MNCGHYRELLVDYVLGTAGSSETADLEAHLATCDHCRKELSILKGTLQLTRQPVMPEPSRNSDRKILALAEKSIEKPRSIFSSLLQILSQPIPATATAAVLCILFIFIFTHRMGSPSQVMTRNIDQFAEWDTGRAPSKEIPDSEIAIPKTEADELSTSLSTESPMMFGDTMSDSDSDPSTANSPQTADVQSHSVRGQMQKLENGYSTSADESIRPRQTRTSRREKKTAPAESMEPSRQLLGESMAEMQETQAMMDDDEEEKSLKPAPVNEIKRPKVTVAMVITQTEPILPKKPQQKYAAESAKGVGNLADANTTQTRAAQTMTWIPPELVFQPEPKYPDAAIEIRKTGTVEIEATVTKAGMIKDAKVLKSLEDSCDQAALEAINQWLFKPGIFQGRPVKSRIRISIQFQHTADPTPASN